MNKRCGCGTHSGRCWGSHFERRVAFWSTFLGGFQTWKSETQGIQLRYTEHQRRNCWRKTWSLLQYLKMRSESESSFWIQFEKYRTWRAQIFLGTRKQYPAGSIQTCLHQGRLGKVERFSQQNWRHRVL